MAPPPLLPLLLPLLLLLLFGGAASGHADPTEQLVDNAIDKLGTREDTDQFSAMRRVVDTLVSVALSGVATTNEVFRNASLYADNALWRDLITQCGGSASLACVKNSVFRYLDRTVSSVGDVSVIEGVTFKRNHRVLENKYERGRNEPGAAHEHEGEEEEQGRATSTFEHVTEVLYDKGVRFLQSHDLRLQLPAVLLDGAVLRVSPRALQEGGGALLTVEPAERADQASDANGRILFKAKKLFRRKLLLGLFALLLVIKLLKVAVTFLLPMLLGVSTAKKILLKVLLFLFPALTHLFKFCSYYHGLHASKFHHHHHQIAHHHHHVPVHVPVPVHVHHAHHEHHEEANVPFHASGPDQLLHGPPPGWGGPPGHDYTARNEHLVAAQHNENELASWGLGGGPGGVARDTFGIADNSVAAHQLAYSGYSYLDDQRVSRSAQPVTEPTSVLAGGEQAKRPGASSASQQHQQLLQLVQQQQQQAERKATSEQVALLRAQQHQLLLRQQLMHQQLHKQQQQLRLQVVTPKPAVPGTTVHVTYDPFYSPILQKMDNVFVQLGFNEEACRERLVCSMYKNPPRFSPHSNLISAELSRDASELQKPVVANSAVTRFHRYVQAARDGQDQKDCLRLYPACTVNTEL